MGRAAPRSDLHGVKCSGISVLCICAEGKAAGGGRECCLFLRSVLKTGSGGMEAGVSSAEVFFV